MNAHVFTDPSTVDYAKVVDVIRTMRPDAVIPSQHGDVVQLISWLQEQVLLQYDELSVAKRTVAERERVLGEERRQLAIALKAASAVMATGKARGIVAKLLGKVIGR